MKNRFFLKMFSVGAGIIITSILFAMSVAAEIPSSTSTTVTTSTAPQLTTGVPDVVKLAQSKVSDNTIVTYIQNANMSYAGMSADEIVYLHDQGVSDRVVTTMLNQRQKMTEANAQWSAQQTAAASTAVPQTTTAQTATVQYPVSAAPVVTYVQPPPVSTIYIAHDWSYPRLAGYGCYPSYGSYGYYGSYYPSVSFSFGIGGRFHDGGFRGGGFHSGFHGGGHHH